MIETHPIFYGTLIRYSSIPTMFKNYGLASMNIGILHYVICCVLGSAVFVPLQVEMGENVMRILNGEDIGNSIYVTIGVLVCSTIFI